MKAYEAVAETLQRIGVKNIFGLMGDGNMKFLSQLDGPRFIGARHETAGVAMAEGYARASGRVGVCSTTLGPGLANAFLGLRAATMAETPLVFITGDTPPGKEDYLQYIDQTAVFSAAGAGVEPIADAGDVSDALVRAFERAASERRPIGLSIPLDMQDRPSRVTDAVPAPADAAPPVVGAADIAATADLIRAARRPVVLAGKGAVRSGARPVLIELADRIGALLTTTLQAKDLFADQPYSLGIAGGFSTPVAADLLRQADLVLAFGASLNEWTGGHGALFDPAVQVVACDIAPRERPPAIPVTSWLIGDAAAVAESLLTASQPSDGYRAEIDVDDLHAARRERDFVEQSTDETIDPRTLFQALDDLLPAQRTLTTDGGQHLEFGLTKLSVPDPSAFVYGAYFGSIGLGMGTAIGAAYARPDLQPVLMIGDGGLMMTLGEIETAVRYRVPLLIVVDNDSAYGAELHHLDILGLPRDESLFDDVDFAGVARQLGAAGFTVRRSADLDQLRPWLDGPEGPCLLDCKVNPAVRASWMDSFVDHKAKQTASA